jgi:hypothetical protein
MPGMKYAHLLIAGYLVGHLHSPKSPDSGMTSLKWTPGSSRQIDLPNRANLLIRQTNLVCVSGIAVG